MRLALAEVKPRARKVPENLCAMEGIINQAPHADLVAFPELYLTGYALGDTLHRLALSRDGKETATLLEISKRTRKWIVTGAPFQSPVRSGEVWNVALVAGPDGTLLVNGKRHLPNFGPFEEGLHFSAAEDGTVVETPFGRIGTLICYEVFFPEVARKLALKGVDLLLAISASPVTSRTLFEKLLPARAIENGTGIAYVNRVGVEDSIVFDGGSEFCDPRGEVLEPEVRTLEEGQRILEYDLPLEDYARFRPARPVLRDVSQLA